MAADATSYLIQIATEMGGGDAAVAQLTAIAERMHGVGGAAQALDASAAQARSALESTGAASTSAAAALAESQARYNQIQVGANRAALEVEKLGAKSLDLAAKMQAAMDAGDDRRFWRLAGAANALAAAQDAASAEAASAASALAAEGAALDAVRAKALAAADAHKKMGANVASLEAAAKSAARVQASAAAAAQGSGKLNDIAEGFGKIGGPAGAAGQKVLGLVEGFKKLGGAAGSSAGLLIGVAAAVVAVTAAVAAGIVAITKWGVGLADAARNARMGKKDLLSLDTQAETLRKHIAKTFGGLKIEPLLKGVATLVALFDSTTASGRFLKFVFEGVFQPFVDGAAKAIPKVEAFLLGVAIGALKVYIALKPAIAALKEVSGVDLSDLPTALEVGKFLGMQLAVSLGLVVLVLSSIVFAVQTVIDAFKALGRAAVTVGEFLTTPGRVISETLASIDLRTIGSSMIQGLVEGILGGVSGVVAAVTALGQAALATLKSVLKIGSPSKVFESLGGFTAEGFTEGVGAGSSDAQAALESMVSPPASRLASIDGATSARSGGGVTVTIEHVEFNGVKDAADALSQFESYFTRVLAGDALALGGGEVPA